MEKLFLERKSKDQKKIQIQELQESRKNWKRHCETPHRESGETKNIVLSSDA